MEQTNELTSTPPRPTEGAFIVTPSAEAPPTPASEPVTETPLTDQAINEIRQHQFDPNEADAPVPAAPQVHTTTIMFSPRPPRAVETIELVTEDWPHGTNERPNPISINRARELLALAYATIDCEIPGADDHGHAWMIEEAAEWLARSGTGPVAVPTKPALVTDYADVPAQMKYEREQEVYRIYFHLTQEGKARLIEWFGKSMFADLHHNCVLPIKTTPREMLEHLALTYALPSDYCHHMRTIDKMCAAPHDTKLPVEDYFMKLQECKDNAQLLKRPYTDQQVMDKALEQFEEQYGRDASKAEKRWNRDYPGATGTWTEFKRFWKEEIHAWSNMPTSRKNALQMEVQQGRMDHLSATMEAMSVDMANLAAENHSYREQATRAAYQMEGRRVPQDDELSALSGIISELRSVNTDLRSRLSDATATTMGTGSGAGTAPYRPPGEHGRREAELLRVAKVRPPDSYKDQNGRKGRKFDKYCVNCGVNCTHTSKGCYELSLADRDKYKDATATNRMGGSTKFLDRVGKYQSEYGFNSL